MKVFDKFLLLLKDNKIRLVSFALATMCISGCGMKNESNLEDLTEETIPVTDDVKESDTLVSPEISDMDMFRMQFSGRSFELENVIDTGDCYVYRIKEDYTKNEIYCRNLDEFRKYVTVKNPTYDDVLAALSANQNITGTYEEWIAEGINNLKNKLADANLVALYYNISRMTISEQNAKEIRKVAPMATAYFHPSTGAVVVDPKTVDKSILCHEALGHGINEAQVEWDGKSVYCTSAMMGIIVNPSKAQCERVKFGRSLEEGKATMINSLATNIYEANEYALETEQLRIFNETVGNSLTDYINDGCLGLINDMTKNDIDYPINYVKSVDGLFDSRCIGSFTLDDNCKTSNNLKAFLLDYADDKLKRDVNIDDIQGQLNSIIMGGHSSTIVYGFVMLDFIDMDSFAEEVRDELNALNSNNSKVYSKE